MSPLAIRRITRRLRRRTAGLLVVLALGGLVAVHHFAVAMGQTHHHGITAVIELCVGVVSALGAFVAAVALRRRSLGRWPRPKQLAPVGLPKLAAATTAEARAGPPRLPFLCVWRR